MKPWISHPVLLVWLLLGSAATVPYLRAALAPPPGYQFAGTFHWIDDFYHYASYVQQSEDGAFLFRNKLVLESHPPALANLEWWAVGKISRLSGRRPFLAYRLFALAAFAGLLFGLDRAFRRAGLPPAHRFPALLLASIAGGLGGLLFELTPRPVSSTVDLSVGLFPFLEVLANPHWLAGTWLLVESILAWARVRSWRDGLLPTLLASALALVRPYDFVLAVAIHVVAVLVRDPLRLAAAKCLPLVGLAPAVLYNYWVFYRVPAFSSFATTAYSMPETSDFVLALLPAMLLALLAVRPGAAAADPDGLRLRMGVWAIVGLLVVALRPVAFSQQFAVGLGLPLLFLGALGLARWRPALATAVALACGTTAAVALRVVLRPDSHWFVPTPRMEATLALRPSCRPGDLLMSPADIGLYSLGLTACHAFVSHPWAPGFEERERRTAAFYGAAPAAERRSFLEELRVTHLVLPGDPGASPDGWLGDGSGFVQLGRFGAPPETWSVYARLPGPR
jgi:hypothetical protein